MKNASGEFFMTKMVVEHGLKMEGKQDDEPVDEEVAEPKGQDDKAQLAELKMTLPPDLQVAALQKIVGKNAQAEEKDEIDSQFSEILSDLDKDEGNAMDIKELKQKKRYAKRKKTTVDKPLGETPKAKAKPKAKGKAKQKPRSFLQSTIFKKQRELKQKAAEAAAEAAGAMAVDAPGDMKAAEAAGAMAVGVPGAMPEAGGEGTQAVQHSLPEPVLASGPSSSSGIAGPSQAFVGEEAAGPSKKVGPKVFKTREDLLSSLSPPAFAILVNQPFHRFTASSRLDAPYAQKTFSQSFGERRPWEEALRKVHEWAWKKWNVMKDQAPLPPHQSFQDPGKISDEVMERVAKFVANLPPKSSRAAGSKTKT